MLQQLKTGNDRPISHLIQHSCRVPALLLMLLCGCAETSFLQSTGKLIPALKGKSDHNQAARLLCLWEAAEGQGLDERTSRGFAGQILFFGYGDPTPMQVEGDVRIYQYDNYDADDPEPQPIHVFNFDSAAWSVHHAESTVGHSYNVFLPYVKRQKNTARCALKVEFVSAQGRTISSPITEITLEGRRNRKPTTQQSLVRNVLRKETTRSTAAGRESKDGSQALGATRTMSRIEGEQLGSLTIRLPGGSQ